MAASGSTSVAVTSWDTLKFVWTQTGQSVANNTTTISWQLQLVAGTNGSIVSSALKDWSVTVNGTKYSGTNSVAIANGATKTLASGTTTIAHNADGTKAFSYAFSQEFAITFGGASIGTISGSGSGTLNAIARATKPTLYADSVEMGGTATIYTYAASSSYTHDLAYAFAGSGFVTFATDVESVYYWRVPDLASQIPNATSGTVTIRCTTKNGSNVVGTATVLMAAKVPASVVPSIGAVTLTEATTGLAAQFGAFIQSKSKLQAAITASGASGSTIKSYSTTLLGKTYTGATWTSDVLTVSGSISLVTTVTDSRGRTAQKTTTISVLAYTAPQITAFSVARYTADGQPNADGTRLWATYAYSVASLGSKNTAAMVIEYKRSTSTSWSQLLTNSALSANTTAKPTSATFSTDYQYDLRITVTDWFGASTTYGAVLPSGKVILDIRADGKGVAFFETCTEEGVTIAGELPGSAISLVTGANLNDLTTPGFYVIPSTAISGSVTNKPYTDTATASIRVESAGIGMLRQIVQKSTKTDGVIYERGYDGTWGAWSVVYSGAGKMLWAGSQIMTAAQSVTFSEPMNQQQSGIVLVFSRYISGTAQDYYYSLHFVPKQLIATTPSSSASFIMATAKFEAIAAKYLIITNTGITGNDQNDDTGTSNGVTFANNSFALRYVIGV